jgi:hypothetical protein
LQARDLNAEPLSKTAKGERANLLKSLGKRTVIEATRRRRQNPVTKTV